ncbi:outer membrane protein assembly factor BamD [Pseudemcibacter aquimaris]|uniref:outer membrane protein assembly factor BamD n=1 Tax=Pseudemcibacter aquimaris TaxID=2857064 RepID=UPI0020129392|nr:outer membrane protein assembly factor BamD [Pseudemcibacter aquimaris]MCC3861358.1 outer membrane protein assembly factor BamD [Pseudemcibacter aquimaris]WDU58130.1 outer membrane protein assembly factor BamD [Pseudemcibacter aquimaris]
MNFRLSKAFIKNISVALVAIIGLSACGGGTLQYRDLPVEQLYVEAQKYSDRGQWKFAAVAFDEVERQHPYSVWATRSKLMSAYAHYMANNYEDAILTAQRYLALHPGNKNAAYARYIVAQSYYEQIADVRRDQMNTELALFSFNEVIRLHPDSDYAKDARVKIELTLDHLAGKQMEIGRFYQSTGDFFAAIGRFNNVVDEYETTSHTAEALHRITEAYLALGIVIEARKSAEVLALNYPDSEWNGYSQNLLQRYSN